MALANVVVMGKTGAGKSTLINSIFKDDILKTGMGKPITQEIRAVERDDFPLRIYDTKGLELKEETQAEVLRDIEGLMRNQARTNDPGEFIHYIWYCVNSRANRIEEFEIELIKKLSENVEIILVLTQCIGMNWEQLMEDIEKKNLPVLKIVPVMALNYEISQYQCIEAFGLYELIELSMDNIDSAVEKAGRYSQYERVTDNAQRAKKAVKKCSALAFAAGLTPIPFQDAFLLVPNEIAMINKINKIFGIKLDKESVKILVTGVMGTIGATAAGKTIVSNVIKLIPGIGTAAGGAISAGTASFLTAALGHAYIEVSSVIMRNQCMGRKTDMREFSALLKEKYSEYLKKGKSYLKKKEKSE